MTPTRILPVLLAAGMAVAGCANIATQIDTLKPVAGDEITALGIAVNDVLLDKKVPILVAPVCTYRESAQKYHCEGTTTAGTPIEATAAGSSPETFSITVAGDVLFEGSITDVLTKAGQA